MAQYKYRIVAEKLLSDIHSGKYQPGVPVPSSRELSAMFSVSQLTAVKALAYLAKKRALVHYSGKNYCVSHKNEENAFRFITLLFRPVSLNGPEFYGNKIISGITNEAASALISCCLLSSAVQYQAVGTRQSAEMIRKEVQSLGKQNIGIVADYFIPDEILADLSESTGLPIAVVGRNSELPFINSVVLDVVPAYREMYHTLKRLGYEAFICCLYDDSRDEYMQQLEFFSGLSRQEQNMRIIYEYNVNPRWRLRDDFNKALNDFRGKRIAVILASDYEGRWMLTYLKSIGLNCPEDVGVVSFYNTIIATGTSPHLTGVAASPELLGKTAVEAVITKSSRFIQHKIPTQFIFGETI